MASKGVILFISELLGLAISGRRLNSYNGSPYRAFKIGEPLICYDFRHVRLHINFDFDFVGNT